MLPLKLSDIEDFLRDESQSILKEMSKFFLHIDQEYALLINSLEELLQYYKKMQECELAFVELKDINVESEVEFIGWCLKYKDLGYDMFGFAIKFLIWDDAILKNSIKVWDNVYVESKPFKKLVFIADIYLKMIMDGNDGEIDLDFSVENIKVVKKIISNYFYENT